MKDVVNRCWNNQKGVTLIELLAVVVILGVVAAIAAPSVLTNFNEAKQNADLQTKAIIEDAAKRMVMDAAKDMELTEINRKDTASLEDVYFDIGGGKTLWLKNYLDVDFQFTGIPTAQDPDKYFRLDIKEGKVTVTIGDPNPPDYKD